MSTAYWRACNFDGDEQRRLALRVVGRVSKAAATLTLLPSGAV